MTTKKGVLIFLALFVFFYILIYIVPTVSDIFTQTYIAEYGTLEMSQEANCVIVRNEEAYKTQVAGTVDRVSEAGEIVKAGSHVLSVGSTAIYNEKIGIVSYYYDGYESKINSENMTKLGEDFIKEFKESPGVQKAVSGNAQAGNTVFKIIDRTQWYLAFWTDKEESEVFQVGEAVTVDFGDDSEVQMEVSSITKQGQRMQIILSCDRIYEDFDRYRVKECTITAQSSNGIIINTDSIVEKDGVQGVYVVDKYGKENFTPIQIYSTQGDKTVVAKNYYFDSEGYPVETVKNYDEILKISKE